MTHEAVAGPVPATVASAAPQELTGPWQVVPEAPPSLDLQFIRLCGRGTLSSEHIAHLRALGQRLSPADWQQVQSIAAMQGMAPLVFTHAAHVGLLAAIPATLSAELAAIYQQTLVNNRRIQKVQWSVLTELAAQGIETIAVKGVTLAARYYGELALRPIRDIDLLVRRRDLPQADEVLRRLGYHAEHGLARPSDFLALELATLSYVRNGSAGIELHWELPHRPGYRAGLATSAIWPRSQVVSVGGHPTRCLSLDDELRYLCVHCTVDHQVGRLIWLVDIAQIVRALPTIWDWQRFVHETAVARLAMPVAVALAHCQAWLDLELPPGVLDALVNAASQPEERRAWATAHGDVRSPHGDLFSPDGLRAHLRALDSMADRVVFLTGIFLVRPWRIRELYGIQSTRWRSLPLVYLRHWYRMAGYMVEALRA